MKKLSSKFYLVGIKGTGMSSFGAILKNMGFEVVGSDKSSYFFTEDILNKNAIKFYEFNRENITNGYYYIIGNAYGYEGICLADRLDRLAGMDITLETPSLFQISVAVMKANSTLRYK